MNTTRDPSFDLELATAGLLHDLRNIIGVAKGLARHAAQLIENGRAQEAISMLRRIDQTTTKGTELCGDVLECSRRNVSGHAVPLAGEDVDVVALTREQLALTSTFVREHGATIDLFVGVEVARCRTHRRSLERVLSNLLQNAVRYGAGRPIDVHVTGNVRGTVLIVRDRGTGIPPATLSRLFAPYGSKGQVDVCFERFGLGLWIVRSLVESLGGTIHVVSQPELGTAVSVFLPADRAIALPATGS